MPLEGGGGAGGGLPLGRRPQPRPQRGPADPGRTKVRAAVADRAATRPRSATTTTTTAVLPAPAGRLEVVAGMGAKSFGLSRVKYVVGRAPGSDIQPPVDSVSSRHAAMRVRSSGFVPQFEGEGHGTESEDVECRSF